MNKQSSRVRYLLVVSDIATLEPGMASYTASHNLIEACQQRQDWAVVSVCTDHLDELSSKIVALLPDRSHVAQLEGVLFADVLSPTVMAFNKDRLFDPVLRNISNTCTIAALATSNHGYQQVMSRFTDALGTLALANIKSLDQLFVLGNHARRVVSQQVGLDPYVELHSVPLGLLESVVIGKDEKLDADMPGHYWRTEGVRVGIVPPYASMSATLVALSLCSQINKLPAELAAGLKFNPVLFGDEKVRDTISLLMTESGLEKDAFGPYELVPFAPVVEDTSKTGALLQTIAATTDIVLDVNMGIDSANPVVFQAHRSQIPVLAFSPDAEFPATADISLSRRKMFNSLYPDVSAEYLEANNIVPCPASVSVPLRHSVFQSAINGIQGTLVTVINKTARLLENSPTSYVFENNIRHLDTAHDVLRRVEVFTAQRGGW